MKLTKAQLKALKIARTSGGVIGFGNSEKTIKILCVAGLLSSDKDDLGYFNITPAGRAALAQEGE